MADLISLPGGKKLGADMHQMSCAECGGGLFNWRIDDSTRSHLMTCANCNMGFPINGAEAMELVDVEDDWI